MEVNGLIKIIAGIIVGVTVIMMVAVPILGTFTAESPEQIGTNPENMIPNNQRMYEVGPIEISCDHDSLTLNIEDSQYTGGNGALRANDILISSTTISFGDNKDVEFDTASFIYDGSSVIGSYITGDVTTQVNEPCHHLYFGGPDTTGNIGTIQDWYVAEYKVYNVLELSMNSIYIDPNATFVISAGGLLLGAFLAVSDYTTGTNDYTLHDPRDSTVYAATATIESTDIAAYNIASVTIDGNINKDVWVPSTYTISQAIEPQISGPVASVIDILPLIFAVGMVIFAIGAFVYFRS